MSASQPFRLCPQHFGLGVIDKEACRVMGQCLCPKNPLQEERATCKFIRDFFHPGYMLESPGE